MKEPPENQYKTVARNTFFLYFRMILVSIVALYTTRVTLQILGIKDFGIYNVVGGIVGFLGVLNGSLISATQRFLSFEVGKSNIKRYNQVFSMLLIIFAILSMIVLVIGISIGNWAIGHFLVIPENRLDIARWLFILSLITFILDLTAIPYMSSLVAHEKMNIYAYMSILEVFLKLAIVYFLHMSHYDKLLTYGILITIVTAILTMGYRYYCVKKIDGCQFHFFLEKKLFKKLLSYTGWNLFGSVTSIMNMEGQAVLLNIFFGPTVNAAKAIADKINGIAITFSNNFYMAVRPQIIKNYASGNYALMHKLVLQSSKFSFFLLFVITLPLAVFMHPLLELWLGQGQVSGDMVIFSRLMLIFSLVNVFEQPITVMIQATGNIKYYQIATGFLTLSFIPICYVLFKIGFPPYASIFVLIFIYSLTLFVRLIIAKRQLSLSIGDYCKEIFVPITIVSILSSGVAFVVTKARPNNWITLIITSAILFIVMIAIIITIGITKMERNFVISKIKMKFSKNN